MQIFQSAVLRGISGLVFIILFIKVPPSTSPGQARTSPSPGQARTSPVIHLRPDTALSLAVQTKPVLSPGIKPVLTQSGQTTTIADLRSLLLVSAKTGSTSLFGQLGGQPGSGSTSYVSDVSSREALTSSVFSSQLGISSIKSKITK